MNDPIRLIYEGLEREALDEVRNHSRPPQHFRASEADHCMRRIWYRLNGFVPAPRSTFLDLVADAGNMYHDWSRQLANYYGVPLRNLGFDEDGSVEEEDNVRVEVTHNGETFIVTARADGDIDARDMLEVDEEVLADLEVKSVGFWYYKYLNEAFQEGGREAVFKRVEDKHRNYIWQTTVTATIRERKYGYLAVVNRDNGTIGLHNEKTGEYIGGAFWEIDPELYNRILNRLAAVAKALRTGNAPPPEYAANSKECGYCPFKYRCHDAAARAAAGLEPAVKYPVDGVIDGS